MRTLAWIAIAGLLVAARQDAPKGRPAEGKLKVGDAADFELARLGAAEKDPKVKLADFKGKKPVALVFGSYT